MRRIFGHNSTYAQDGQNIRFSETSKKMYYLNELQLSHIVSLL